MFCVFKITIKLVHIAMQTKITNSELQEREPVYTKTLTNVRAKANCDEAKKVIYVTIS